MDVHVYAFFSHSGLHRASGHHTVCALLGYMYIIMSLHHLAGFLGIISFGLRGFSYLTLGSEPHITSWSAVTTQADSLVLRGPWVFRNLHNLLHVALPCFISLYVCCWILLPLLPDPQILELSMNCGNCWNCSEWWCCMVCACIVTIVTSKVMMPFPLMGRIFQESTSVPL